LQTPNGEAKFKMMITFYTYQHREPSSRAVAVARGHGGSAGVGEVGRHESARVAAGARLSRASVKTLFGWLISQSLSSTFLSHKISTSHQPVNSTFLSQEISTIHQPKPAEL